MGGVNGASGVGRAGGAGGAGGMGGSYGVARSEEPAVHSGEPISCNCNSTT